MINGAIVDVETTVPNLLSVLCSTYMPPRQHLETQQALFKQFAEIIDFTLKFDDLKVAADLLLFSLLLTGAGQAWGFRGPNHPAVVRGTREIGADLRRKCNTLLPPLPSRVI